MTHSGDLSKLLILRRDVDELMRKVGDLDDVRENVAAVAEVVHDLAARQQEARPAPIHWPDLDDETFAQAWPALLSWMREVLVARYPRDAAALTPCWWQHLDVVDALTAGWQTWLAAYWNPAAEPTARADWQGRWRPAMTQQITDALRGCTHDGHEEPLRTPEVVAGAYRTGASV